MLKVDAMNIVTAGDSSVFHCLEVLTANIKEFYGKKGIVYDLGLSIAEKEKLDAVIEPIELDEKVNYAGKAYLSPDGHHSTRATHKPFCVREYFRKYDERMMLVDADVLFRKKVEVGNEFDVAVTFEPGVDLVNTNFYNGVANSGVIFFNNPCQKFVEKWCELCLGDNTTDQKALTETLEECVQWQKWDQIQDWHGLKVRMFDARIYNDHHLTSKSSIIHFITSRHRRDIYHKLIEGIEEGKDLRKMFREIKRGKRSGIKGVWDKMVKVFR